MTMKWCLGLVALAALAVQLNSAPIRVAGMDCSPQIDGKETDACWQGIPWQSDFHLAGKTSLPDGVATRFKAGFDHYYLYFLLEAGEPSAAAMKKDYPSTAVWQDECLEIFLAPGLQSDHFFQLIVNPSNHVFQVMMNDNNTGTGVYVRNPDWSLPLRSAVTRQPRGWTAEVAIPLGGLNLEANTGTTWRFNVARERYLSGKHEIFTLAPTEAKNLLTPNVFVPMTMVGFDPRFLAFKLGAVTGKTVANGAQYTAEIQADVTNSSDAFTITRTRLTIAMNGKTITAWSDPLGLMAGEYKRISFACPLTRMGNAAIRLELFRGTQANPLPLRFLNTTLDLTYQPVKITVLQPHYRQNIYASQKLKRLIVRAEPNQGTMPQSVSVTASGNGMTQTRTVTPAGHWQTEFDITGWKDGDYQLSARLGHSGSEVSTVVRKLPSQTGETWLSPEGVTMVDGQPFLPFGWYSVPVDVNDGSNVLVTYQGFGSIEKARQFLDLVWKNHKKVILYPYQEYRSDWGLKILDAQTQRQGELTEVQTRQIAQFVNAIKDHPAILAWYMADEPENHENNPNWYVAVKRLLEQLDPYHPCIMTNWGLPGILRYWQSADIIMPDYYPNYIRNGLPLSPMERTAANTAVAAKYRSAWLIPQAFCWDKRDRPDVICRPPTLRELRNQIHQAFCSNAKGIVMFDYLNWSRPYHALREGPRFIATELMTIKEELLAPNREGKLSVSSIPATVGMVAAFKQIPTDRCIIAANPSALPAVVSFKLSDRDIDTLYQQSTKRVIPVSHQQFSDTFLPYESKVYLTSQQKATATDLARIDSVIENKEKQRFKPGNLVAIGEKTVGEFHQLQKDDFSKVPAILTASSVKRHYFIRQYDANSLYFLFDGITDSDPWMNWQPEEKDSQPWLQIAFPAPRKVGRVVLYTAVADRHSAVAAASVQTKTADGKWTAQAAVADNARGIIELSFPETETRAVKITLDKLDRTASKDGVLSEIEVFGK